MTKQILLALMITFITRTAAADIATYKDVQWFEHDVLPEVGLTMKMPYAFRSQPVTRPSQRVNYHDGSLVPSIGVSTPDRIDAVPFEMSAKAVLRAYGPTVKVLSESDVDLGGTPAKEVLFDWTIPVGAGVALRTLLLSVYLDGKWVLISASDGQVGEGISDTLRQTVHSSRFQAVN